jgi:hypothetical protein
LKPAACGWPVPPRLGKSTGSERIVMIAHGMQQAAETLAVRCGATKDDAKAAGALALGLAAAVDPIGACVSLYSLFTGEKKDQPRH